MINDGSPLLTTMIPFMYPMVRTIIRVKIAANGMAMSASMVNRVTDILENPIKEPIERSNSPPIIRSVTPTARIPISEET